MFIQAWIKYLSYSKQIQWLVEQRNYSRERSTSKNIFHFFKKWQFEKFINRMNGGYQMMWKLSYGN